MGIAEREVVHSNIVTTFYTHLVVLCEGRMVEVFLPVGLVVVEVIEEVSFVFVKEGDVAGAAQVFGILRCSEEFGDVVAILAGIHYLGLLANGFEAAKGADLNARHHTRTTACRNLYHAVGSARTIECRTVLNYLNVFDVFRVNNVEHVVDESIVQGGAVVLHILQHAVDNDKRLCIGVKRVEAIDKHNGTLRWHATAIDGANGRSEVVFNFVFDGERTGVVQRQGGYVVDLRAVGIERANKSGVKAYVLVYIALDGYLRGVVARKRDV